MEMSKTTGANLKYFNGTADSRPPHNKNATDLLCGGRESAVPTTKKGYTPIGV